MSVENKRRRGAREVVTRILPFIMIAVTAATITVTGIIYGQLWWKMLPLYISLLVGLFQTQANRYATLVGGTNSVIYAGVNFAEGLYGQSAYSLLVSFPVQIATFIRWSKNKYKQSTKFRRMSWRVRGAVYLFLTFVSPEFSFFATILAMPYLSFFDFSDFLLASLVGLTFLSFVEYSWFMMCTGVVSIILDAVMMADNPARITFLVFSVYSMICVTMQFITVQRLYKEQQRGEE